MMKNKFNNKTYEEIIKNIELDEGNAFININHNAPTIDNPKYIGIKDVHSQTMLPTTMGSKMLENYTAPFNSTVVQNLIDNGFHILGTLNMDQFAMGSTNKTSYYGPVDNATNSEFVSGGSSGGSAYAVAKGLIPFATGTDTGGSIRQPAAFNGIYGMKPTYGLVSRYGTLPFASSFDVIGPMTKNLKDNAILLNVLASNDEKDQTNFVPEGFDSLSTFDESIKGMRIGIIKEWMESDIDNEIRTAIENQIDLLKSLGVEIIELSVPLTKYSFELYLTLAYAEVSSNLNRFDGIKFGINMEKENDSYEKVRSHFGTEVKKRLIIGTYMLASEHAKEYFHHAQKVRKKISLEFDEAFNNVDAIIGATTPNLAFSKEDGMSKLESYLSDQFAIPANLVGFPSLNIPMGYSKENLAMGMQIMSNKYQENVIYQIANAIKGGNNV